MVMTLIAHMWGIDEVGVFVIPAVVALLVLRWVDRRARAHSAPPEGGEVPERGEGEGAPSQTEETIVD
jgi:hypothetical protein